MEPGVLADKSLLSLSLKPCTREFPPVKTTELYKAGRTSTSHIPALVAAETIPIVAV